MSILKTEIEALVARPATPDNRVLSIYLDVDQSKAANLNRRFEPALKQMLRNLEQNIPEQSRTRFQKAVARVLQFVARYQVRGRTLILFADSEDFLWQRELKIRMRSEARWNDTPFIKPLLEAIDEYERYAVVLVNQEEARLFTVYCGEIEENREIFSENIIKRTKQPAKDNLRSSFDRKLDNHALWHLKNVAEVMDRLADQRAFDRLVLAGGAGVTSELSKLLTKRLQSRVVASIPLAIDAGKQDVLEETLKVEEQVERANEARLVEELITAASKGLQAALGLQPVLDSWREGRMRSLVYADGYEAPGSRCEKCNSLFPDTLDSCTYCGGSLRPEPDLVDRLGELVIGSGGHTEHVRGQAAERLRQAGGIGALLRF